MSFLSRLLKGPETQPVRQVDAFLQERHVPYQVHHHPLAFTAQEVAKAEHVPGKMMAKVVIGFADGKMVMFALPAPLKVNLCKLLDVMGTEDVRLAREEEFVAVFPECEAGAMPPFGNLYNLPVYVDKTLAEDERIVFRAGTHTDTIEMSYADFADLVHPRVADFAFLPRGRRPTDGL